MTADEAAKEYYKEIVKDFPQVHLHGQGPNPVDPDDYLIYVDYPEDEDELFKFSSRSASLSSKFLDHYGILITPVSASAPTEPASN